MFDTIRLEEALAKYKQDFVGSQWKNERYKWEAVKVFQDNWNVNATDFTDMLIRALSKTYNLLWVKYLIPQSMTSRCADKLI